MFCENCKINQASGYIEESKAGIKRRLNLCAKCLNKKEQMILETSMFSPFFAASSTNHACLSCGTTLNSILNTLFVGCPDCYNGLGEELNPIIKNLQNAVSHAGTRPGEGGLREELKQLKLQLAQAVKEERFEDAAILKRRINEKEGKI
ncbi:MAG: UvrB/UvrC motif-containing protein [Firmicutes bacterium]|nr:UvrB/UvrC motif-containing protein [Bacillota bacterium]